MTDSNPSPALTGRDLVLSILRHQPTRRPAWVPFAGVHAGKLKGHSARLVLTSADCLFESLLEVNRLYRPDGQPVMFDLQVEAEILGCELAWADDSPPSVATHPLTSLVEIPSRLPTEGDGRLPLILDVMRRMKAAVGQTTALYGLVTGPFTLASHLRGTDLFLDLVDQPDRAAALLAYTESVAEQMASLYTRAGMDVIAVVDPMISQISPRHFQRLMLEPFSRLFRFIREQGAASAFFVCGDATRNIQGMCQTGPDSIAVDENVDFIAAKQSTAASHIALQGNIPLTSCLLLGSQQDTMKYVVDLLDQVEPDGLIISPGCDMPYATPPENVTGASEAVPRPRPHPRPAGQLPKPAGGCIAGQPA